MTMTSDPNGKKDSTEKVDKQQIKLMGGFLRTRLEADPLYVAKLFIKLLGKNFFQLATRLVIIISFIYILSHFLSTYTNIPKAYTSIIYLGILLLYYSRKQHGVATWFIKRVIIVIGADRLLTYYFNQPPGTVIVIMIIGGLFFFTYKGIFMKVKEDTENEHT